MTKPTTCSIDKCTKPLKSYKLYCPTHYARNRKHGSPHITTRKIVHKLRDKNLALKTANCTKCGLVEIRVFKWKNTNVIRCKNAIYKDKLRQKYGYEGEVPLKRSCQICGSVNKICLDHDHSSSKIRGWLCNSCNVGLANYKDSPALLRKAAEYLEKHKPPAS